MMGWGAGEPELDTGGPAGGGTWTQHGVTASQVLAKVALIEDGSAALGVFARELIADSVGRGFLVS